LSHFWETGGFNYEETSEKTLNSFCRIEMDFDEDIYSRKKKSSSNVQLHKRTKKYPKIKEELRK
jgi:hypothetical protein